MSKFALRTLFVLLRLLRPRKRARGATLWLKKKSPSGPFETY